MKDEILRLLKIKTTYNKVYFLQLNKNQTSYTNFASVYDKFISWFQSDHLGVVY